jgi:hypothetical protein
MSSPAQEPTIFPEGEELRPAAALLLAVLAAGTLFAWWVAWVRLLAPAETAVAVLLALLLGSIYVLLHRIDRAVRAQQTRPRRPRG